MRRSFTLNIVTPNKVIFEGKIISLVVSGYFGYLGVLVDHAPLVTVITPGKITCLNESGKEMLWNYKGGGILEVIDNTATLLLDRLPETQDKISQKQ